MFAEMFLENIGQSNGIKGITIGKKELKTSAFADDRNQQLPSTSWNAANAFWKSHWHKV